MLFSPIGQMVDLLCPPLGLGLEVDKLPEVVTRHVLHRGGLHLHLRHGDQDLHHNTRELEFGFNSRNFCTEKELNQ